LTTQNSLDKKVNHLISTVKLQSNGPLYTNTVISTLADYVLWRKISNFYDFMF